MDALEAFMGRHEKVVLQFSAGKDSAACLKLLRPYIDKVIVLWGNQGRPYPETVEYMLHVQRSVPRFITVRGRQPEFIAEHGHPADTLPWEGTRMGRELSRSKGPLLTSLDKCCGANLWLPVQEATRETGATGVVRGEKQSDQWHSSNVNGSILPHGQEYFAPLDDWTDQQVLEFLGDDVPPSYKRGLRSSLDCTTCTAFLHHNPRRIADLKAIDPDAHAEVMPVLAWMHEQAREHLRHLEEATR